MFCPQVAIDSTELTYVLDRLTVRSIAGIRSAAQSLHDVALSIANLRTAPCANIASKDPMIDGDGEILACEVFGWRDPGERWWERPHLALTSPLTMACRYESEAFWCNHCG